MPDVPSTEVAPWEPLYDAVALGMWMYTTASFRVDLLGDLEPEAGALLVSTHRAETDVPLLCPCVYRLGSYQRGRGAARLAFAARDDMFERGFFGGFPPGLPLAARRLLYPLRAGSFLPRVRVHPIPYPSVATLRLGHALERIPGGTPLREVIPPELVARFTSRASETGLPEPRAVADVLRGSYADVLWLYCSREELASPAFADIWRARAVEGSAEIRRLIDHLRTSGEMLLIFPEGRPRHGEIGPVLPGLDLFVRRAKPPAIVLIAIAYDHLTARRPAAVVAFGAPFLPKPGAVERDVLSGMRRLMPLTAGQLVSYQLLGAIERGETSLSTRALAGALGEELERCAEDKRPVETRLASASRLDRLSETLAALVRRGVAEARSRTTIVTVPERAKADAVVRRLAVEYESARQDAGGPAG